MAIKRGELIENHESISYGKVNETYQIPIKGWDLKNPKKLISDLMEEFFDYKIVNVDILKLYEMSYSCSKYDCGESAESHGYRYFINYHEDWKMGLGKCTIFSVIFAVSLEDGKK